MSDSLAHDAVMTFPRISHPAFQVGQFLLVAAALVWLGLLGNEGLGYNWQWYRVPQYLVETTAEGWRPGPLLQGLVVTFQITVLSLGLTFVIGLTTAMLRLSDSVVGRVLARLYLECVRNTPLLIQIFFIYFVISPIVGMDRFTAAVIALSLFEGAYASEIFRAGILSVERGQWEAAYALGLTRGQIMRHVIVPQAMRRILPPLASQAVSLIKDSALVSTIAVYELTMRGQVAIAESFLTFELWFTVAAIYLCITVTLSLAVTVLDHKLRASTR